MNQIIQGPGSRSQTGKKALRMGWSAERGQSREPGARQEQVKAGGASKLRGPACAGSHRGGAWVKDAGDIHQRPGHSSPRTAPQGRPQAGHRLAARATEEAAQSLLPPEVVGIK